VFLSRQGLHVEPLSASRHHERVSVMMGRPTGSDGIFITILKDGLDCYAYPSKAQTAYAYTWFESLFDDVHD
jgi:hypothetical protein